MLGIRGAGLGEVIALKRNELPHHMHLLTLVDLSVALGIPGTAIVSSKILIEYLVQTLSSLTSDTPPSVSDVAAIPVALELLEFMHLERERIKLLVQKLYDGIGTSYTVVGTAPLGSFVTVRFPKLNQARLFHRALLERGFITDVYPLGLPLSEESAVRFVLRSDFTDKTVDMILDTLHEIRKRGA
jgi:7-keto-8-aminopelargonate synthetase-like enzyme